MTSIRVIQRGAFKNTEDFLRRMQTSRVSRIQGILNKYGAMGVTALSNATPRESSLTANSWSYEVVQRRGYYSVRWFNSNRQNGSNIAILLQYGHGTKSGAYVQGQDYVMPAIRPIFDKLAAEAWKEVTE